MFLKANFKPKNWQQWVLAGILFAILVSINIGIASFILMMAWNYVVVPTFGGVNPLGFWTCVVAVVGIQTLVQLVSGK